MWRFNNVNSPTIFLAVDTDTNVMIAAAECDASNWQGFPCYGGKFMYVVKFVFRSHHLLILCKYSAFHLRICDSRGRYVCGSRAGESIELIQDVGGWVKWDLQGSFCIHVKISSSGRLITFLAIR